MYKNIYKTWTQVDTCYCYMLLSTYIDESWDGEQNDKEKKYMRREVPEGRVFTCNTQVNK